MLVGETPSAICWSSARDTIATVGIVSPMVAMAEPSARLMLFCSRLTRADFAAASPSGSSTIAAMTTPTKACGSPAAAMPRSSGYESTLASSTTATSER